MLSSVFGSLTETIFSKTPFPQGRPVLNALAPMLSTGRPSIISGTVISVSVPVYLAISM